MANEHEELCEAAKEAINRVFGDTSVSQSETLTSLKDIICTADEMIDSIEETMEDPED